MNQKSYNIISGVIFSIICILHLVRSVLEWPANIAGWQVPTGVSVIIFILAGFLAYTAFKQENKKDMKDMKDTKDIESTDIV